MDSFTAAEDEWTKVEGWEDPLLPQPALPLPKNTSSAQLASTFEIVRAATSAVSACEDIDSSGDLLQPLAEAYLLAVRNEARQLPKVTWSAGTGGPGTPRHADVGRRTGAGSAKSFSSGQHHAQVPEGVEPQQGAPAGGVVPPKWPSSLNAGPVSRDTAGEKGEGDPCRSGDAVAPVVGPSASSSELISTRGDRREARHTELSLCTLSPDTLRSVGPLEPNTAVSDARRRPAGAKETSLHLSEQRQSQGGSPPQGDAKEADTRVAPYMERLLAIERERRAAISSAEAPGKQWSASTLSEFTALRQTLEAQSSSDCPADLPALPGDCRRWSIDEWSLYCRCHPPSFGILRACDTVTLCRLLLLLVEDVDSQRRSIARSSEVAERARPITTVNELQRGTACTCCRDPASHLTLQQACWLFGVLLYLDELQAMDADVAFCIQTLRRQCEQAREAVRQAKRTTVEQRGMSCSSAETTHSAQVTEADEGEGEWAKELVAALNLLIVITNDFFKQK